MPTPVKVERWQTSDMKEHGDPVTAHHHETWLDVVHTLQKEGIKSEQWRDPYKIVMALQKHFDILPKGRGTPSAPGAGEF